MHLLLLPFIMMMMSDSAFSKKATDKKTSSGSMWGSGPKNTPPSLEFSSGVEDYEESKLSPLGVMIHEGQQYNLKPVSHGLRKKRVYGLAVVRVYVLEFFAADPDKLNKTEKGILDSLKNAGAVGLRLTLARDIEGSKIADSFLDGLKHNGLIEESFSKELTEVMTEIRAVKEFEKGQTFSLGVTWKDGNASVYLQKPDGALKVVTGPEKFATDLLSIWFGEPVDDRLGDLKKALLK